MDAHTHIHLAFEHLFMHSGRCTIAAQYRLVCWAETLEFAIVNVAQLQNVSLLCILVLVCAHPLLNSAYNTVVISVSSFFQNVLDIL